MLPDARSVGKDMAIFHLDIYFLGCVRTASVYKITKIAPFADTVEPKTDQMATRSAAHASHLFPPLRWVS
jgi:hypothetical protein